MVIAQQFSKTKQKRQSSHKLIIKLFLTPAISTCIFGIDFANLLFRLANFVKCVLLIDIGMVWYHETRSHYQQNQDDVTQSGKIQVLHHHTFV